MAIVGLGIDLVDVDRIEHLTVRHEEIFRTRILGDKERAEIPFDLPTSRRNTRYACAVAAKEALLKALGTGLAPGMRWPDIQMAQSKLAVSGETQKRLADLQVDGIHVSVSARGKKALAAVVLTRDSNNGAMTN